LAGGVGAVGVGDGWRQKNDAKKQGGPKAYLRYSKIQQSNPTGHWYWERDIPRRYQKIIRFPKDPIF